VENFIILSTNRIILPALSMPIAANPEQREVGPFGHRGKTISAISLMLILAHSADGQAGERAATGQTPFPMPNVLQVRMLRGLHSAVKVLVHQVFAIRPQERRNTNALPVRGPRLAPAVLVILQGTKMLCVLGVRPPTVPYPVVTARLMLHVMLLALTVFVAVRREHMARNLHKPLAVPPEP